MKRYVFNSNDEFLEVLDRCERAISVYGDVLFRDIVVEWRNRWETTYAEAIYLSDFWDLGEHYKVQEAFNKLRARSSIRKGEVVVEISEDMVSGELTFYPAYLTVVLEDPEEL